ncbi:MAG: acyl-CoA reductase [Lachnospiraceae bacterium]|nr:acyl-CoA reductase [Lachnospiraceae bacterium]
MYYLGIDGGGTKTAFALMNEEREIIATYETTGCYYATLGKEGLFQHLDKGIKACVGSIDFSEVVACAGIPIYGESESLMEALKEIGPRLPVKIIFVNDVEVGYYGALGFQPGINIVSGTGSIAIGFDEAGNVARSGGYGPELEGDEGSAHYIGRKLIYHFTRQVDLRETRTLLYDAVMQHFDLKKDIYIMGHLLEEDRLQRDKIASLSKLVTELATKGDPTCLQIFDQAAAELDLLAVGLMRQLAFQNKPIQVSYSGGVFQSGDLILKPLMKRLETHDMELVAPLHIPVYGACLKATTIK